jgi:hypothetical protein
MKELNAFLEEVSQANVYNHFWRNNNVILIPENALGKNCITINISNKLLYYNQDTWNNPLEYKEVTLKQLKEIIL